MLMKALRQPRSADRSSLWSRPRIFRLERVPLNQEPIHFQTERRSFAFDARLRHVRLARLTRTHRLAGIGDAADCRSAMAMWSLGRRSVTSGSMTTPPDPMGPAQRRRCAACQFLSTFIREKCAMPLPSGADGRSGSLR